MKTILEMKLRCILLGVFALFVASCSNEDDNYTPEINPISLIGTTFTDNALSFIIESKDSISFYTRDYPDIKGKAAYEFRHGIFRVINNRGPVSNSEEITEAYIDYLEGTFSRNGMLECDYSVIGPQVLVHMYGMGGMWKLEKDE